MILLVVTREARGSSGWQLIKNIEYEYFMCHEIKHKRHVLIRVLCITFVDQNLQCHLSYVFYFETFLHKFVMKLTANGVYLSWSPCTDTHSYGEEHNPVKTCLLFSLQFLEGICDCYTYWYINSHRRHWRWQLGDGSTNGGDKQRVWTPVPPFTNMV